MRWISRRLPIMASAGALAIGLVTPAYAEAAGSTNNDAVAPAPKVNAAEEQGNDIVVTARRREERLQDVPVAITALSATTLQNAATADVMQIAQLVPSMVVGRQVGGSGASIYLRGIGSSPLSSGFDQSVSTVVDGLPMSRGREVVFAQYDLQQLEVLKGPQALFFGKNSTGGIINITTANPTENFEGMVKAGYEFASDQVYGEGFISGPVTDTLKARLAVRGSTQEGAFVNSGGPGVDQFGFARDKISDRRGASRTLAGRLTLLWEPTDRTKLVFKAGGTIYREPNGNDLYERLCGQGRTTPLPSGGLADPYADCKIDGRSDHSTIAAPLAATTPYFDEHPYTRNNSYVLLLNGTQKFDGFSLNSITGYYHFDQQDVADYNGSTFSNFVGQSASSRQFSQELRIDSDLAGPFNFTLGAFYADTHFEAGVDNVGTVLPVDAAGRYFLFHRIGSFDGTSYSVFASVRLKLAETLELAGGARYSHDLKNSSVAAQPNNTNARASFPFPKVLADRFTDNNVSPEATLTWKPTSDLTVYGAYKVGYKAGGFNTSMQVSASAVVKDGQFGSEKARGGEVGVRLRMLDGRFGVNLTAYNYKYTDLQVQSFDPVTIALRVANAGALRTRGVEGEFTLRLPSMGDLEVHGSAAYNDAPFTRYVGPCYTGQTISGGCNLVLNASGTAFTSQDYAGRQVPKAPKFAARFGASLPLEVTGDWTATPWFDVGYSSAYNYSDTLRPDAVQKRFARLDAGLRLGNRTQGWEFAVIGRNLTNQYVVTSANDFSFGTGVGGTGTATGKASDLNAIVDAPRQVFIQVTKRF